MEIQSCIYQWCVINLIFFVNKINIFLSLSFLLLFQHNYKMVKAGRLHFCLILLNRRGNRNLIWQCFKNTAVPKKITTKTFHLFHTHAPPLLSLAPAAQQPAWQRCTFPLQRAAQGGGSLSNNISEFISCLKAADTSGCYRPIKLMITCFISDCFCCQSFSRFKKNLKHCICLGH